METPADIKARALFWRHLSPQQKRSFKARKAIVCIGSKTKEPYVLFCTAGWRNVYQYSENGMLKGFCSFVDPGMNMMVYPVFDLLLIKKLLIENNESMFRKTSCSNGWHITPSAFTPPPFCSPKTAKWAPKARKRAR